MCNLIHVFVKKYMLRFSSGNIVLRKMLVSNELNEELNNLDKYKLLVTSFILMK
jgi:hypothetical protein